jgi:hypothetical protein
VFNFYTRNLLFEEWIDASEKAELSPVGYGASSSKLHAKVVK